MIFSVKNTLSESVTVEYYGKVYTLEPYQLLRLQSEKEELQLKVYINKFSNLKGTFFIKSLIQSYCLNLATIYNIKLLKENAIINLLLTSACGYHKDTYSFVMLSRNDVDIKSMSFKVLDDVIVKERIDDAQKNIKTVGFLYGAFEIISGIIGFLIAMLVIFLLIRIFAVETLAQTITNIIGIIFAVVSVIGSLVAGAIIKKGTVKKKNKNMLHKYKNIYSLLDGDYIYEVVKTKFVI